MGTKPSCRLSGRPNTIPCKAVCNEHMAYSYDNKRISVSAIFSCFTLDTLESWCITFQFLRAKRKKRKAPVIIKFCLFFHTWFSLTNLQGSIKSTWSRKLLFDAAVNPDSEGNLSFFIATFPRLFVLKNTPFRISLRQSNALAQNWQFFDTLHP